MPGTYSQLFAHTVFAVKGRQSLISPDWETDLNSYIFGILKEKGQKPYIVNGMPDHIHILFGFTPSTLISDVIRDVKNNSSNFINHSKLNNSRFSWQEGYGAFSISKSQTDSVFNYILNQKNHHKTRSFKDEYTNFLCDFGIEFNEKYLFDWVE